MKRVFKYFSFRVLSGILREYAHPPFRVVIINFFPIITRCILLCVYPYPSCDRGLVALWLKSIVSVGGDMMAMQSVPDTSKPLPYVRNNREF